MNKGKFIVFEGIDGAGKTTQIELLASRLSSLGESVHITAEPTTNESGKALRRALSGKEKKTECEMAVMFVADRIAHNIDAEEGIARHLSEGKDVICDRYYYSTLAYQGSVVDYGWVKRMNLDCPAIRKPDLCIFLDLSPEESLRRISASRSGKEIYENVETLTRVRASFHRVLDDLSLCENIVRIDASAMPEEISWQIRTAVACLENGNN